MKYFLATLTLIFLSSCSTFQSAFQKAAVQEKMVIELKKNPYSLSLNQLQSKVVEYLQRSELDGTWVFVSQVGHQDQESMRQIDEAMQEGFFMRTN